MAESTTSTLGSNPTPPGSLPGVVPGPFSDPLLSLQPPPLGFSTWWDFHETMKHWLDVNGTRSAVPDVSEKNSQTLRSLALALRTARTNIKSEDADTAARGRGQVIAIVAYITGFLDGKRIVTAYPGLLSLALSRKEEASLDDLLAKFEKALDDAATATRTGAGWAGAAVVGGLGILAHGVGFALDAIATAME